MTKELGECLSEHGKNLAQIVLHLVFSVGGICFVSWISYVGVRKEGFSYKDLLSGPVVTLGVVVMSLVPLLCLWVIAASVYLIWQNPVLSIHENGVRLKRRSDVRQWLWEEIDTIKIDTSYYGANFYRSGDVGLYNHLTFYGNKAKLFQIKNTVADSGLAGESIAMQICAMRLPELLDKYRNGETLDFRKLKLNQHGVIKGKKLIAWDKIQDFQIHESQFSIRNVRGWHNRHIRYSGITNLPLLLMLIRELGYHIEVGSKGILEKRLAGHAQVITGDDDRQYFGRNKVVLAYRLFWAIFGLIFTILMVIATLNDDARVGTIGYIFIGVIIAFPLIIFIYNARKIWINHGIAIVIDPQSIEIQSPKDTQKFDWSELTLYALPGGSEETPFYIYLFQLTTHVGSINQEYEDFATLHRLVKQYATQTLLPKYLNDLRRNDSEVQMADIVLTTEGIRHGQHFIRWNKIHDWQMNGTNLAVQSEANKVGIILDISGKPNALILPDLIAAMRDGHDSTISTE